jgi:hypothetical protein
MTPSSNRIRASVTFTADSPDVLSRSVIPWPALSAVGAVTNAPPRAPSRISTSPLDSSTRSASRSDSLLTPSCSQSSRSEGRRWPSESSPLRIMARSRLTIAAEVRTEGMGANSPAGTLDSSSFPVTGPSSVSDPSVSELASILADILTRYRRHLYGSEPLNH